MNETREFYAPSSGRRDVYGVEWWRTDGTTAWYRFDDDGRLVTLATPEWEVKA